MGVIVFVCFLLSTKLTKNGMLGNEHNFYLPSFSVQI